MTFLTGSMRVWHHVLCLFLFLLHFLLHLFSRSFAKPPRQVQTVLECVLIMRGYKELNWKTAKGMMSEANFLKSLMEIDFDGITQSQVKAVRGKLLSCILGMSIGSCYCDELCQRWSFPCCWGGWDSLCAKGQHCLRCCRYCTLGVTGFFRVLRPSALCCIRVILYCPA